MNTETSNIEYELKLKKKLIYLIITVLILFLSTILSKSKVVMIKHSFINSIIIVSVIIASFSLFLNYFKNNQKLLDVYYQICDFSFMLLTAVLVIQIITSYLFFPAPVDGNSMFSTLNDGDFVIVNVSNKVKRFDMVVMEVKEETNNLENKLADGDFVIKRIIGLPGDNIYFEDGKLYINDEVVNQDFLDNDPKSKNDYPYELDKKTRNFTLNDFNYYDKYDILVKKGNKFYIPEDYYFIMGDNRKDSYDSSLGLGLFHKTQIMGIPKYKIGFLYIRKLK